MSQIIRVAACSYEGSIFGWSINSNQINNNDINDDNNNNNNNDTNLLKYNFDFGFHVAIGSFKAIAVSKSGKYLAVGGVGEKIHIYNMNTNRSLGEVSGHTGSITHLEFFEDKFLISSSEDNTMYIWRTHDWQNLHILGGHKDSVINFSIHPTGKLALSISKDKSLRLWNLIQGKCSYTRNLKSISELILWTPDGDKYLLSTSNDIQLFNINNNELEYNIKTKSRINDIKFIKIKKNNNNIIYLIYICDNLTLTFININTKKIVKILNFKKLNIGRLKSISITNSIGLPSLLDHNNNNNNIDDEDIYSDNISLITSNGHSLVLSSYGLLYNKLDNNINNNDEINLNEDDSEEIISKALYANHHITVEPRLVKVVSWNVYDKNKQNEDNEEVIEEEEAQENEESEEEEEEEEVPEDDSEEDEEEEEEVPKKKVRFNEEQENKKKKKVSFNEPIKNNNNKKNKKNKK